MPDPRRRTCQVCRKNDAEVGPISWRGKCGPCGIKRTVENMDALHHMTGAPVLHWRRRMVASVGGVLLDDARLSAHTPET